MYMDTIRIMGESAVNKANFLKRSVIKYLISSAMAGMYVGFGIMLSFSVGAPFAAADSPAAKTIMGVSFGIALSLVIFAGSELFTGNSMVMAIGNLLNKVTLQDTVIIWILSYMGNLMGSFLLAFLTVQSGLLSHPPQSEFILTVAASKMNAPAVQLFLRGILCNMLVCLAIWSASRAKGDTAKLVLIWWCLYGFVGAGFEHSIANMSLLGMALFIPHDPTLVSIGGTIYNLAVVTAGNIVGGTFLVGITYWYISKD